MNRQTKNSCSHCKFHIRWRLFIANYFPTLQFFVFTPATSTNQHAPLFNQSAPSTPQCLFVSKSLIPF